MSDPTNVFDRLRARGEEVFARLSGELMSNPQFLRAMQAAYRGKETLDQAVGRAMKTMNVPTRTEFKRAVARIEALEQELAAMREKARARPRARKKAAARAKRAGRARSTASSPAE
jgi:hypothetical protein